MDGIYVGDKVYNIRPLRKCASDWDDELKSTDRRELLKPFIIDHSQRPVNLVCQSMPDYAGGTIDSFVSISGINEEGGFSRLDYYGGWADEYDAELLVDMPNREDRIQKIIKRISERKVVDQIITVSFVLIRDLKSLVKNTFDNFVKEGGNITAEVKGQIDLLAKRFTDIASFIAINNNLTQKNTEEGEEKKLTFKDYFKTRDQVADSSSVEEGTLEQRLKYSFPENSASTPQTMRNSFNRCVEINNNLADNDLKPYSVLNAFLRYIELLATMKADDNVEMGANQLERDYFPAGLSLHPELKLNLWGEEILTKIQDLSILYNNAIDEVSKEANENSLIKLFNNLISDASLNIQEHLLKSKELMKVLSPLKLDTNKHLAKIGAFIENIREKIGKSPDLSEKFALGDIILADKGPVPFFQELIASSFRQAYNLYQQTKGGLNEAFNGRFVPENTPV